MEKRTMKRLLMIAVLMCSVVSLLGCNQPADDLSHQNVVASVSADVPKVKTQTELEQEYIREYNQQFDCHYSEDFPTAASICMDNLRSTNQLVRQVFGADFEWRYEECLAHEPKQPKNVHSCKVMIQRVDTYFKKVEAAQKRKQDKW
jgi:hypothetical protein